MDILVTSPDQLRYFLPQIAHSLSPRATKKWVDSARFLCKVSGVICDLQEKTKMAHIIVPYRLPLSTSDRMAVFA